GLGFFSGLGIDSISLVVFIVAMSITHTFIDFIPAVFLGAPEEDSLLSVLPGHKMLLAGRGYEAVVFTFYGSLTAILIILFWSLIFSFFLDKFFGIVKFLIPFILIFVSLYFIFRERNVYTPLIVFLLSGVLGFLTFNLPVREPLLPLLSGLFGVSGIIVSLKNRVAIPKQRILELKKISLKRKDFLKAVAASFFAAPLCSFLPGIGSGQASLLGSEIMGSTKDNEESFLFLNGAVSTIVMGLSFVTLFSLGKSRTGTGVVVGNLIGKVGLDELFLILIVVIVSGFLAFILGLFLARLFARGINLLDYRKVSFFVLLILLIVNIFLSNWIGLVVLVTGSALGVFSILSGTRRINLIGCLLIPSIIYYLF
ncbi:MAG: tripartite tricarboxylate transporter permease, partial [Nanoarchaeota archaeon]